MLSKVQLIFSIATLLQCGSLSAQLVFPPTFKFGTATSAFQIEGGFNEDGKSISNWDRITLQTPEMIQDGSNATTACDSYHKWREDVRILKDLGVNFYRFSIAWTRIIPEGYTKNVNQAGVDYYNSLIDALLAEGIEPMVTMYHWDMPDRLSILGGLHNPNFIKFFANYATILYDLFGDRVKTWITFNEPNVICDWFAATLASLNPSYPGGVAEYLCSTNLLKSHAEAYHIYDKRFRPVQNGRIGITLNSEWAEPLTDNPEDVQAAERRLLFDYGTWAHPIVHFGFPQVVIDRVAQRSELENFPESRLPVLSTTDKIRIKGTADFLGLNHYSTWYVQDAAEGPLSETSYRVDTKVHRTQNETWEGTASADNKIVPWGLRRLLNWIRDNFNDPEILITECGMSDDTGEIDDRKRVEFYRDYLSATLEAVVLDGVKVTAFTAWSLMDNFEWIYGYAQKFGLYHVDFEDPERPRTPKESANYYKNVIQTRSVETSG